MTGPLSTLTVDRERAGLWLAALALAATLAYVAYRFVGTVVLGLFAYYATRPLFERVADRVSSRTLAAAATILLVTLPALVLFTWTFVLAAQELTRVAQSPAVAAYLEQLQAYAVAADLVAQFETLAADVAAGRVDPRSLGIGDVATSTLAVVGAALSFLAGVGLHAFIVLVIAFYLLRDDYRLARWARGTFVADGGVIDRFFSAVDANLGSVYFGNLVNAFVTGTIGAVTYNVLAVVAPPAVPIPLPTLIGVLAGVGSLVPVVGMKIVWIPVALALFVDAALTDPALAWFPLLFAAVSVVVVDTIPDFVLRPYVSGRDLHLGAVMLAYIFGPLLWGWYGIFLGPLVLVLVVAFGRVVLPWLLDRDATPVAVGPPLADRDATGRSGAATEPATDGADPDADSTGSGDESRGGT